MHLTKLSTHCQHQTNDDDRVKTIIMTMTMMMMIRYLHTSIGWVDIIAKELENVLLPHVLSFPRIIYCFEISIVR